MVRRTMSLLKKLPKKRRGAGTSRGMSDRLTTGERADAEGLPAGAELCLVSAAAELIAVELEDGERKRVEIVFPRLACATRLWSL